MPEAPAAPRADIAAEPGPYVYNVLDMVGEAKVIASGADDLPRVDISMSERNGKVMPIGASYGWDVFELRKAARLNVPLSERRARSARLAIARQVDKMLATGTTDSQTGLGLDGFGGLRNATRESHRVVPGGDHL